MNATMLTFRLILTIQLLLDGSFALNTIMPVSFSASTRRQHTCWQPRDCSFPNRQCRRIPTSFNFDRQSRSILQLGKNNANPTEADTNVITNEMLDQLLKVAMLASQKAAALIAQNCNEAGAAVVETKSTSRDLLTFLDPLCEASIRETITEHFPDHGILGEEGVAPGIEAAVAALDQSLADHDFLWIVDPIDGTTNLASGLPFNAPSVAVAYQGELLVGVIHDPHRQEVWTAVRGRGASLNETPLQVPEGNAAADGIGEAVIGCESPAGHQSLEVAVEGVTTLMPLCRTLRILGSTAIKLPWVAKGRLTSYWSPDECAWDHAAGALIIQEAGGIITDLDGSPFSLRTRKFIASQNDKVHREILQALQPSIADYL